MTTTTIIVWDNDPDIGCKTVMCIEVETISHCEPTIMAKVVAELPNGEQVGRMATFPAVKRNLVNASKLMLNYGVEV